MPLRSARHRWLIWLTLWVVCLATLAPVLSRALAAGGTRLPAWVEVCSASGSVQVQLAGQPAADDGTSAPAAIQLDSCPLCVLMGDRLAPVSGVVAPRLVREPLSALPLWQATDPPVPRILAAPPRGPPILSASFLV